MPAIRILTRADVRAALSMADAIEATRSAFGQLSAGKAVVPIRTQVSSERGTMLLMPAYLPASGGMGAKLVCVFPGNPSRDLPTVNALVTLLDVETGLPVALLDGTYLTALRTGAASGVATDLLALPDAATVAVFGAGVQARTQLLAICEVRDIKTVWIYDQDGQRAEAMATEMAAKDRVPYNVRVAGSPGEALREAMIVTAATTSSTPVFDDADLLPGAHINAVGAFTPEMQEIPAASVGRARVYVDQRAAALAEAGDLLAAIRDGLFNPDDLLEIGEVINGRAQGRTDPAQLTLFKSVGNAVQDIAAATRAVREAEARGLGTVVEL